MMAGDKEDPAGTYSPVGRSIVLRVGRSLLLLLGTGIAGMTAAQVASRCSEHTRAALAHARAGQANPRLRGCAGVSLRRSPLRTARAPARTAQSVERRGARSGTWSHHDRDASLNPTDPAQLERARRLLAHEAAAGGAATRGKTAAGRVYDKLHVHLAPLVGVAGVHMLFARSARLAQGEFARLAAVSMDEGSTKLRECLHAPDPAIATESAAALFGHFFTLITIFIGERLVAQLLRSAWPTFNDAASTEKHR